MADLAGKCDTADMYGRTFAPQGVYESICLYLYLRSVHYHSLHNEYVRGFESRRITVAVNRASLRLEVDVGWHRDDSE